MAKRPYWRATLYPHKVTVGFPEDMHADLLELADLAGVSLPEAVRRAASRGLATAKREAKGAQDVEGG